jgi:predicted flap endonuclease-1-like 5' DNA nuclease
MLRRTLRRMPKERPMALFPEIDVEKATASAQKAMQIPLGMASPLWLAYSGMASAGVAYWWMSQFTKPVNVEAMSAMFKKYSLVPMPEMAAVEAPALVVEMATEEMAAVADAVADVLDVAVPEPALLAAALEPEIEAAEVVEMVAPKTVEAAADDLTRLTGIGPTLASKLSDLGVKTYADIASWTSDDIEKVDKSLKLLGRATRDNWIGQAKQFAEATAHH